ncbi:MAG: MBL fold metallo-hydrolase [Micromonosporaceae bacterium]|nr:MBL fold metallo-hydrolase [Micromonosporaceae bacterium]
MCDAALARLPLGDRTVESLCDGHFERERRTFFRNAEDHPSEVTTLQLAVRAFLVRAPAYTALIDSGLGTQAHRLAALDGSGETLPERLRQLGVASTDVDLVVYTHLHFDHFGSIGTPEQPTFPLAEHYMSRREFVHWRGRPGPHGEAVAELVDPFVEAGAVRFVDETVELREGLIVSIADGHTPGHLTVRCTGSSGSCVFIGDLLHHPTQITTPELSPNADEDPELAESRRWEHLSLLASTGWAAASPHLMPGPYWTVQNRHDRFTATSLVPQRGPEQR